MDTISVEYRAVNRQRRILSYAKRRSGNHTRTLVQLARQLHPHHHNYWERDDKSAVAKAV